MRQFIAAFAIEIVRLINSAPGGRSALRIRPGATAIRGGGFVVITLRGGDAAIGISVRDRGRIDRWLRSAGFAALIRTACNRAWQRAGKYVAQEIAGSVRFTARLGGNGFSVTVSTS